MSLQCTKSGMLSNYKKKNRKTCLIQKKLLILQRKGDKN